ncbi:unnamed protein product [Lactuca saligna]|uniref:Uncharacterized protein n=1 Tax=Lactuca saligna TaxID=75948 RepID=A0AA35Y3W3_LACSI|nr:unnamed protein product [Lactuca saligna]
MLFQNKGEAKKPSNEEPQKNTTNDYEALVREKEAGDAQVKIKNLKDLFPPWSTEQILNEDIDNPMFYLLEPIVSFGLDNSSESQLDFMKTPKAFLFCCFDKIEKAPDSDNDVNLMLISFYLEHG